MTAAADKAGLEWVLIALHHNTKPPSLEAFREEVATHIRLSDPPPAAEMERLIVSTYDAMSAAGDCI